ncbi:hypothetical protein FH972_010910 [Carpinus fangiana]|uniref:Uncharacterized protein n=1 Tax=Carpinus fangiana TaxID=176857 RepID=A0A660KRJ2_9ROSI|nr:hypothetical protein FH972_010910 [Carpinus fangiana]
MRYVRPSRFCLRRPGLDFFDRLVVLSFALSYSHAHHDFNSLLSRSGYVGHGDTAPFDLPCRTFISATPLSAPSSPLFPHSDGLYFVNQSLSGQFRRLFVLSWVWDYLPAKISLCWSGGMLFLRAASLVYHVPLYNVTSCDFV